MKKSNTATTPPIQSPNVIFTRHAGAYDWYRLFLQKGPKPKRISSSLLTLASTQPSPRRVLLLRCAYCWEPHSGGLHIGLIIYLLFPHTINPLKFELCENSREELKIGRAWDTDVIDDNLSGLGIKNKKQPL
ncbi:unnamed protein product [Sphenostylis stenocarpa]|uniref:Uncharacterized protein n=1 Tax=Sphenostylis stenocarpa TaxID=92480 RepID=A0AA86V7C9_9FABA|nr:unnamed protein product [Sphenostylis stenocarpa]